MASGDDHERVAPDPRWQAIHELRLEGLTYTEIGATLALGSRERTARLWTEHAAPEHAEQVRQARAEFRRRARERRRAALERRRRAEREELRRDFTRPACRRIVLAMQEWELLHGAPPSANDWNSWYRARVPYAAERYDATGRRWPTSANVVAVFGSWNEAMQTAGFEPRPARWRKLDRSSFPKPVPDSPRRPTTGRVIADAP